MGISCILCPFGRHVTLREVGGGLVFRASGQRDGTEQSQCVADVGLVSRPLGQRQCLFS